VFLRIASPVVSDATRRGEMASNRREDPEVSMLALHLLQKCMVCINTLMIQKVLASTLIGRASSRYATTTPP
jgi:TnpA family transposase